VGVLAQLNRAKLGAQSQNLGCDLTPAPMPIEPTLTPILMNFGQWRGQNISGETNGCGIHWPGYGVVEGVDGDSGDWRHRFAASKTRMCMI